MPIPYSTAQTMAHFDGPATSMTYSHGSFLVACRQFFKLTPTDLRAQPLVR